MASENLLEIDEGILVISEDVWLKEKTGEDEDKEANQQKDTQDRRGGGASTPTFRSRKGRGEEDRSNIEPRIAVWEE